MTNLMQQSLMTGVLAAALSLALAGCEREGPMERTGERIDDAADDVGDGIEDAADDLEDAVDDLDD